MSEKKEHVYKGKAGNNNTGKDVSVSVVGSDPKECLDKVVKKCAEVAPGATKKLASTELVKLVEGKEAPPSQSGKYSKSASSPGESITVTIDPVTE